MELSRFRALSFDCYGTLIDWEGGILAALTEAADGASPLPADRSLERFGQAEEAIEQAHPHMLYTEVLFHVYKDIAGDLSLPADGPAASKFATSIAAWEPFPDSVEALRYLGHHFRLAVLSNIDKKSFTTSNKKLGEPFDYIFTAEEIGSYKPNLNNFKYLVANLEKDGIRQDELLHIAQSRFHDIAPASAMGINSVWVNRRHDVPGEGATVSAPNDVQADLEVSSLEELVALHAAEQAN